MIEVIRNDLFKLSQKMDLSLGCVILRKEQLSQENPYLDQVLVTNVSNDDTSSFSSPLNKVINDIDLYNSIDDGDIGMFNGRGSLRVLLSRKANHNTLLVTERCDNRCLFCSQPPKDRDDEWLLTQAAMAIAAFQGKEVVGISGGEPLLYRDTFLRFLDVISEHAPSTPLHILTNGRAFSDSEFAKSIALRCQKQSLIFGVPLYSAVGAIHDQLVGAEGAFSETFRGLINAGNSGIPIELRFIPTKQNISNITSVVELATRCLSNLSQLSIMNLEPTGWAKKNWLDLYVEPESYVENLQEAVYAAERACLPIYLFNYPLCHLSEKLRSYAVKSISDWKNYYPEECEGCLLRDNCTGFFTSSRGIYHQQARKFI